LTVESVNRPARCHAAVELPASIRQNKSPIGRSNFDKPEREEPRHYRRIKTTSRAVPPQLNKCFAFRA
jgi:hypothetical protein